MHDLNSEHTYQIIGAAIEVQNLLGFGYLEKVYKNVLRHELSLRGIETSSEVPIKIFYKDIIAGEYAADLISTKEVIIEVKSVRQLIRNHFKQTVNYLKGTGYQTALLINFGHNGLKWHRVFPRC